MTMDRNERNRLSAEWAAYGDALGFMTELADAERVQYRIGSGQVHDTVAWKRKVGGYNGVSTDLPAGSYSDDTQLRLSTSRAIRGDGSFDVAAFAKVELPAWANYALGAGAGSREAASNLARTSATWYSNFFNSKRSNYVRAGGNGAAMRIQPHVWAAPDLADTAAILLDVVRNSVCTHGHPRGILGACLHALTLAFAMREGRAAKLPDIQRFVEELRLVPNVVREDGDFRLFWLEAWAESSQMSFEDGVSQVLDEMLEDIGKLGRSDSGGFSDIYANAIDAIGARDPSSRGSGTKTAILAAFAASLADVSDPKSMLLTLINALGSDTDSIATMAGAIVGAVTTRECDGAVQDREYIRSEAHRLAIVAGGGKATSFRYPDLRSWKPARAAVDAIGLLNGRLWLSGLGPLEPVAGLATREVGGDTIGWYSLPFGQTILTRIRSSPNVISLERSGSDKRGDNVDGRSAAEPPGKLRDLFGQDGGKRTGEKLEAAGDLESLSLNELLHRVINAGFSPELIGQVLLRQVDAGGRDFVERGVALTANILTAYEARTKRRRN
ncbi:MAG: ADP-ribosylglycohydrolase family protein [Pirellulaceae bacterium]